MIFLCFLIFPLLNSRFDPDVHHDGIMYTAALASSKGLMPNRDFFAQYGFGAPFVQGIWMSFTGDSLLSLRVFTAFQLATIALMLFYSCKKFVSAQISFLIAFAWIVQLSARLPWASILSTLCFLSVFLLLYNNKIPRTYLTQSFTRFFSAGVIVAVSSTFRIQNIILFGLLMVAFLVFEKRGFILPFFFGFSFFLLVFFVFTFQLQILDPMVTQTIVWPAKFYSAPALTKSFITDTLWFPTIFLFISVTVFFLTIVSKNFTNRGTRQLQLMLFSLIGITGVLILIQKRDGHLSLRNPKVLMIDATSKTIGFLGYWSATACVLLVIFIVMTKILKVTPFSALSLESGWIVFLGIAALPQLYPLHDQVHLWYVTPVLLISCLPLLKYVFMKHPRSSVWVTTFLVLSLSLSLFSDLRDFRKERVPYSNIVMAGLMGERSSVKFTDSVMKFLNAHAQESQVGFDCNNGIFSAGGKRFLSNDPMFVNWGPERATPIRQSTNVFICGKKLSEIEHYKRYGFIIQKLWKDSEITYSAFLLRV